MFRLRTSTSLSLVFCLLALTGITWGYVHGSGVVRVFEGTDAILPCSPSSKENIVQKLFDWKKDGQTEVFMYDAGVHYNNGRGGQDQQFRGRVSYFQDQLKFGNASITIRDIKMTDRGNYTCEFPFLEPKGQKYYIELIVAQTFRDQSGQIIGAAPKPNLRIINDTADGRVLLQCEVRDASPRPEVEWQDGDGKVLPAEEPQVTFRGDRYHVTVLTAVTKTKTNRFRCVVTQKNFSHEIQDEIYVPEKLFESCQTAHWFIAGLFTGVLLAAPLVVFLCAKLIIKRRKKGSGSQGDGSSDSSLQRPLQNI